MTGKICFPTGILRQDMHGRMYVLMAGKSGMWKKMPKTGTVVCPIAEAQAFINKLKREEYVGARRSGSAPPWLEVRVQAYSCPFKAIYKRFDLVWPLTRYLDLGCDYLVVWVLRWPTEVDTFHHEQKSAFRHIPAPSKRFDPGSGCLQDTWPKVWLLHVLPKQTEYLTV